jgi:hypothetical protein
MTRKFHAMERSLRDGPPDESGYLAAPLVSGRPSPARTSVWRSGRDRLGPGNLHPRRQPLVPTSWLVAMVAVAIALAGFAVLGRPGDVGVNVRTPSASAGPRPTGRGSPRASGIPIPSLTATFVSPRNGFSVRYPLGWDVTPGTSDWKPNTLLFTGSGALDELARAGDGRLRVASRPLVAGETEQSWVATFVRSFGSVGNCAVAPVDAPRIQIDGHSGYLDTSGCAMPADSKFSIPDVQFNAFVFAGNRVYTIGLDGDVDFGYFRAILDTIRLDPASAVDAPG